MNTDAVTFADELRIESFATASIPLQKAIAQAIARYINRKTNEAFPSLETIAEITGYKRRSIRYGINALEEQGLLNVTRDDSGTNTYSFPGFSPEDDSASPEDPTSESSSSSSSSKSTHHFRKGFAESTKDISPSQEVVPYNGSAEEYRGWMLPTNFDELSLATQKTHLIVEGCRRDKLSIQ